ncbi:hypothetical protein KY366_01795 [Candidatus Woesearchaeota archaeon]|nr:hypothetical protein [Candidatus Woesearchaeota archaeon]
MKNPERIALKIIQQLKKEGIIIGELFLIFLVIFKFLFLKSSFILVFRTVFSIFWLYLIPGFCLMYYFVEKMDIVERMIIGTIFGFAVSSLFGYNLGLMGIKVGVQVLLIPVSALVVSAFIIYRKSKGGS